MFHSLPRKYTETTEEKIDLLNKFLSVVEKEALCDYYEPGNIDALCTKVVSALPKAIEINERPGWIRADKAKSTPAVVAAPVTYPIDKDIEKIMNLLFELTKNDGLISMLYRCLTDKECIYDNYLPEFSQKLSDVDALYKKISYKITSPALSTKIKELITMLQAAYSNCFTYRASYLRYLNTGDNGNLPEDLYRDFEQVYFNAEKEYEKVVALLKASLAKK